MQDRAPRNRAQRRQAARKGPALVLPHRPKSQSAPQGADTGTGAPSAETASDYPNDAGPREGETWEQAEARVGDYLSTRGPKPAGERKPSHHAGGGKQQRIYETLVSYYALGGLAISRWDHQDGMLVVMEAEKLADTWIVAGKANPKLMEILEKVTIAGPYTAVIIAHVTLAFAIMDRHGANPFAGLFSPVAAPAVNAPAQGAKQSPAARPEPAPLPYVPVGPQAPTEAPPPPEPMQGDMLVVPDEGLPAEIDVALRQMARDTGRPYQELRQEAIVELAQLRMAQNGHRMVAPGALGAPVARE